MPSSRSDPLLLRPELRDRVLAIDGRHLGSVLEIAERDFCFEFRGARAWLPLSAIFTRCAGAITLIYEEMGVVRHQREAAG